MTLRLNPFLCCWRRVRRWLRPSSSHAELRRLGCLTFLLRDQQANSLINSAWSTGLTR
jgi:hypothetical protein